MNANLTNIFILFDKTWHCQVKNSKVSLQIKSARFSVYFLLSFFCLTIKVIKNGDSTKCAITTCEAIFLQPGLNWKNKELFIHYKI